MKHATNFRGRFKIDHFDKGGKLKGHYEVPNGIVDVGLNNILDVMFDGGSQDSSWYIGLVDNSGWTAFANADTMASHAGWTENTDYTGNRKAWNPDAAASRAMTNSTTVDFAINATVTLKGIFVNTDETGTAGTLWSTAAFASAVSAVNGDTLKVTYTISG